MNVLDRLKQRASTAQTELELRQRELDRKAAEAAQLQRTAERLQRDVDVHADRLVRADAQLAAFKARFIELRAVLADIWGADPQGQHQLPSVPDYSGVVAIE